MLMILKKSLTYDSPRLEIIELETEEVIATSPENPDMDILPPNPGNVRQEVYQNTYPRELES